MWGSVAALISVCDQLVLALATLQVHIFISSFTFMGAVDHAVSSFPKNFEFASLCSFICLQAVYQLSGLVCKATWNGCPSYSASPSFHALVLISCPFEKL